MKKKLVKFLALGLALTMGLAACGNNGGNNGGNSSSDGNGGSNSSADGGGANGGAEKLTTALWLVLMMLPSGCLSQKESLI